MSKFIISNFCGTIFISREICSLLNVLFDNVSDSVIYYFFMILDGNLGCVGDLATHICKYGVISSYYSVCHPYNPSFSPINNITRILKDNCPDCMDDIRQKIIAVHDAMARRTHDSYLRQIE